MTVAPSRVITSLELQADGEAYDTRSSCRSCAQSRRGAVASIVLVAIGMVLVLASAQRLMISRRARAAVKTESVMPASILVAPLQLPSEHAVALSTLPPTAPSSPSLPSLPPSLPPSTPPLPPPVLSPPVLPPPTGPPASIAIASAINARFANGRPSNDIAAAGVVVRLVDPSRCAMCAEEIMMSSRLDARVRALHTLTRDPALAQSDDERVTRPLARFLLRCAWRNAHSDSERPWLPCTAGWCAQFGAHFAATLINAHAPYLYAKSGVSQKWADKDESTGFVIHPTAAHLQCAYYSDGSTMWKLCDGTDARCVSGCPPPSPASWCHEFDSTRGWEWYCGWRPYHLDQMMRQQLDAFAWANCPSDPCYNELVLQPDALVAALPYSIEAVFYPSYATPAQRAHARRVHARILSDHALSDERLPLLMYTPPWTLPGDGDGAVNESSSSDAPAESLPFIIVHS